MSLNIDMNKFFLQIVVDFFVEFPDFFGSFRESPTVWILGNIPLELNWLYIHFRITLCTHCFGGSLGVHFPLLVRFWMIIHLPQTLNWIWVDAYFCFRPNWLLCHEAKWISSMEKCRFNQETFRISGFRFKINFCVISLKLCASKSAFLHATKLSL